LPKEEIFEIKKELYYWTSHEAVLGQKIRVIILNRVIFKIMKLI